MVVVDILLLDMMLEMVEYITMIQLMEMLELSQQEQKYQNIQLSMNKQRSNATYFLLVSEQEARRTHPEGIHPN